MNILKFIAYHVCSVELIIICGPNSLLWLHNGRDCVSNHQPHDCLLNHLFRRRSKKTSKLRITGLCVGNSPVTGEFPAQIASNAENVSISWRHHVIVKKIPNSSLLGQSMEAKKTYTDISPVKEMLMHYGVKTKHNC